LPGGIVGERPPASVLRIEKRVQFLGGGDGGMSAKAPGDISEAALAEVLAASGVAVSPDDIGPVARSLARIERADALLRPPSFDDTHERFYRLLEDDGAGAGA
jgi:hypothetical protein